MQEKIMMTLSNGMALIEKNEYEELIRDSEKLHCIETLAMDSNFPLYKDVVLAICGRALPEVKE